MSSRRKKQASTGNKVGMAVIASVVILLIAVLVSQSRTLHQKIDSYTESNTVLAEQIQAENDRAEELKSLPDYIDSDEFIEKTAREKFGLVYPDEVIFKADEGE